MTASLRPFAADPAAYDAFVKQWFHDAVFEYRLTSARAVRTGPNWKVTFEIRNVGAGRMPVDLAAVRGERFDEQGKPRPGYRDARTRVVLGPSEKR